MEDDVNISWVPGNPNDRSITGFRIRHGSAAGPMGRAFYTKLQDDGIGPRETVIGHKIIITAADEAAWEAARASPTGTEAKHVAEVRDRHHKRALKAGAASAASPKHVSKQRRRRRGK